MFDQLLGGDELDVFKLQAFIRGEECYERSIDPTGSTPLLNPLYDSGQ